MGCPDLRQFPRLVALGRWRTSPHPMVKQRRAALVRPYDARSARAGDQPTDAAAGGGRLVEVGPRQADHPCTGHLAEVVLALLLPEDDLAGVLSVLEEPAVLDLAVELAQPGVARPRPVGAADEPAAVAHDVLEDGGRQVLDPEEPEPAGLTDGFRIAAGHADRDVEVSHPRPVGHAVELRTDVVRAAPALVQCGVEDDQRTLGAGERTR